MSGENEADESETVVPLTPSESVADDDFNPFDDLTDGYSPQPIRKMIAADGLPTQVAEDVKSDIPALSKDTLVCMGDFSSFVVRKTSGEVVLSVSPDRVTQTSSGKYVCSLTEEEQSKFPNTKRFDVVPVEPIRKPCVHYVRQLTQLELNPEHKHLSRVCAARRTTEGTFMGLSNIGMFACSMREPRDLKSEQLLDTFDEKKIQQGASREFHSIFGNIQEDD